MRRILLVIIIIVIAILGILLISGSLVQIRWCEGCGGPGLSVGDYQCIGLRISGRVIIKKCQFVSI